jgi:hypothetical protein
MFRVKIATIVSVLLVGFVTVAAALVSAAGARAEKAHRVVFQMTAATPEQWEGVLTNIDNLRSSLGASETQVEVVVHGKGIGMALADENVELAPRMKRMSEAGGVVFAACENTLKKKKLSKDALLPFVTTVDSGVAHVVRRQEAGWSYVRVGE